MNAWPILLSVCGVGVVQVFIIAWLFKRGATHRDQIDRIQQVLIQQDLQYRQYHQQAEQALRRELIQQLQQGQHLHLQSQTQQFENFNHQMHRMFEIVERRMQEVKQTVDVRLKEIQTDNTQKLELMRQTVDEKLSSTLEKRLGESFKLVSERLDAVHQGLGEMQSLASGVGDLKRVLTNVKSRGTWGEVQLGQLMEQLMTVDQYAQNVKVNPKSNDMVEFAIKLPAQEGEGVLWLPIDAKFPKEEYERLMLAHDDGESSAIQAAALAFEKGIEREAKRISQKYIIAPYTTDFAILFLATEGLYAEALRRPGLLDKLQSMRISLAGPSTLAAMLNALQMGFKSLAIQQRSSEVWTVLAGVKTEFIKFGTTLDQVKRSLDAASSKISDTETRTRVMLRQLKAVETLTETESIDSSLTTTNKVNHHE